MLQTLAILVIALSLSGCRAGPSANANAPDNLPKPPPDLLTYRNESANGIDAGGLLLTDSNQVYYAIESYPMLRAVILDRRADSKVLPFAIERALLLVGPGKVFADVRRDAAREPILFAGGPCRQLLDRSGEPHVWVSQSAFIDESDMPRDKARGILERMAAKVRAGASFEEVYSRTQAEHSYDDGQTRLTRIGNYGDWVLSTSKPNGDPFRLWSSVPQLHVQQLLGARAGDMLILEDDDQDDRCLILYYVREVYRPK